MNRGEALAELQRLFEMPPARHRVWDSLQAEERIAIIKMAGYPVATPLTAAAMDPAAFERCWRFVERFARLCYRVAATNDAIPADDQARVERVIRMANAPQKQQGGFQ